jgi:hypothetical protein
MIFPNKTIHIFPLKPISMVFIALQLFDGFTTWAGVHLGLKEINPLVLLIGWNMTILTKVIICFIVVAVLERRKTYWFSWALVVVMALAGLWNVINLIAK